MDKAASTSGLLARMLVQSLVSTPLQSASRVPASRMAAASLLARAAPLPPRLFGLHARLLSGSARRSTDQPPSDHPAAASSAPAASAAPEAPAAPAAPAASSASLMDSLADLLPTSRSTGSTAAKTPASSLGGLDQLDRMRREVDTSLEEYHLNVFAHKHNTHITVSKPNRDVIVSKSCGDLGFRKGSRAGYDAAYQLGAYVLDWLYQRGWHRNIQRLDVTLRGFGPGREAVTKVLLGTEGRLIRDKITKVADNTRLKFGGTRSPRPRRLG